MGMMARMRSLAPWFILLVGGLFVLFMILSDSKVLEFFGQQRTQNVGSVDGEDITYQEFNNFLERARKNQEQQTGRSMDESQMDNFRDQVWDALVTQKLLDKKVKQFGIVVTNDEVRNAIMGPNPPAYLKQQFIDSTGNFNRQLYDQTLLDPRNKDIMISIEDQTREQLIQEKLQNYLLASITVSDNEVKNKFESQNIKMKADYVMIDPYGISGDFKISDEQAKAYYEKHLQDYKVEASRKLKYVLFRRQATREDSVGIEKNLAAIVQKLKTDTASFKSYVEIYSDRPYSKDTLGLNQIPEEAQSQIVNAKVGDIIGPVSTYEGYDVYKLDGKVKSKDEFVRASHILVRKTGNDAADEKKINEIYKELMNGADFATLAAEKSDDGTKTRGGDLGWFGKGQMVKEFENAAFNGKVGVIQKPIKTTFGWHIIKVTGRSNDKYIIAKIVNKITPSATTVDNLYQAAQDFNYIANENAFESEAKLMKYNVAETPAFTEQAPSIPGIGVCQPLLKWAFDNGVGEISDVYKVQAGYIVAMVSDVIKAGFKPFDEVKEVARSGAMREMRFAKATEIASNVRAKLGDNGNMDIAKTVYPSAKIDSTQEFTSAGNVPGLGREYAFTEYSMNADLNKWSQPVKGNMGVYLIDVKYRTKFVDETYQLQKAALRSELLQQKKNRYLAMWVQDLKKEADITDNRYLFYR